MDKVVSAETLVSRVLSNPHDYHSADALLQLFYLGADTTPLLQLIRATDPEVVEVGCWVFSELGKLTAPNVDELVALLPSARRGISFYVLDCLTSCATAASTESVMIGLDQMRSSDSSVVWKAQRFLWSLSIEIIQRELVFALKRAEYRDHLPGLELFAQTLQRAVPNTIEGALISSNNLLRWYAVVCAIAISSQYQSLARLALSSKDQIVREFAESAIRTGTLKLQ